MSPVSPPIPKRCGSGTKSGSSGRKFNKWPEGGPIFSNVTKGDM